MRQALPMWTAAQASLQACLIGCGLGLSETIPVSEPQLLLIWPFAC